MAEAVSSAIAPTSFMAVGLDRGDAGLGLGELLVEAASTFLRSASASALAASRACWPMALALALASASSCS